MKLPLPRIRLHGNHIFVVLMMAAVVVGRAYYGLTYRGLWAIIGLVTLQLWVLPLLAERRARRLDTHMLLLAQQGKGKQLWDRVRRGWFVRLYRPAWENAARFAWASVEKGDHAAAEGYYRRALMTAPDDHAPRLMANLVNVLRKQDRQEEAEKIHRKLGRKRPDLQRLLEPLDKLHEPD